MGKILAAYPELPSHVQTVTLGGAQYRVRFTFRGRCASWYADVYTRDGEPLALGRRLSPGWALLSAASIPGAPDGFLFVRGSDGYVRGDLGGSLRLVFYTASELPETATLDALEGVTVDL